VEVTVQKRRKPVIFSNVNKPICNVNKLTHNKSITDAGGREFRFRRDLYSQESTFPLVNIVLVIYQDNSNIVAKYNNHICDHFSLCITSTKVCVIARDIYLIKTGIIIIIIN